jgi:plastocyanin
MSTSRFTASLGLVLAAAAAAWASGGTVKGTVTSARGGTPLADAVVMIDAPAPVGQPPAAHPVVEQRNDTFVPHVTAVPVGTTVDFPNHDPRLHNAFSASPAKKFDLGMYDQGETKSVTFDTPGVVRLGCNVHPKMEAFVVVHTNPWAAVTDAHGAYTIAGAPAGGHRVRVWHDGVGVTETTVTVTEGGVQALDVRVDEGR